jgi:Uma2 family endonuclease
VAVEARRRGYASANPLPTEHGHRGTLGTRLSTVPDANRYLPFMASRAPQDPQSPVRAKALDVRAQAKQPVRHLRAPNPIHFPVEAEVPEGFAHLHIRTFLFQLLDFVLGEAHTVGSNQFVYWNARDSRRCVAPNIFVKLDRPTKVFGSWKTWEQGGPPELAVEIVSPNEGDGVAWDEKLARYHELGVSELVRCDPEAPEGARLRAWDRVENDLVEREVTGDTTPCQTLGLVWVLRRLDRGPRDIPVHLRLASREGELVLDSRETEATRADAAEERVRALEEELRRRG